MVNSIASWPSFWRFEPPTDPESTIWKSLLELIYRAGIHRREIDAWIDDAWAIRRTYESALREITFQYPGNPFEPLTEVEVLLGFIAREAGGRTRRGKQLQDEYNLLVMSTERLILERPLSSTEQDQKRNVLLSTACLEVSTKKWEEKTVSNAHQRKAAEDFQSFKFVAAACTIRAVRHAGYTLEIKKD